MLGKHETVTRPRVQISLLPPLASVIQWENISLPKRKSRVQIPPLAPVLYPKGATSAPFSFFIDNSLIFWHRLKGGCLS